jgi:hypothetical protein
MVQDRRNLERMYEQRERDYQRSEMRAEARARQAERWDEECRRQTTEMQERSDRMMDELRRNETPYVQTSIEDRVDAAIGLAWMGAIFYGIWWLLRGYKRLVGWGGFGATALVLGVWFWVHYDMYALLFLPFNQYGLH